MAPERKAQPNLTEATARTTGALRTLQSRLNRGATAPSEEGTDELGNQLREYFAAATEAASNSAAVPPAARVQNEIRELAIAGVVDRILRSWEEPNAGLSALKSEVIERLVEQIRAELEKGPPPKTA